MTKEMVEMKVAHAQGMKHYAQEEQREPWQPVMEMQRVNEEYGGSDGNGDSGTSTKN